MSKRFSRFDPVNILVVDDDESSLFLLGNMLRKAGINSVETARNGIAAKDFLSSANLDVVLLDLSMPIMDGFEMLEWIRHNCNDRRYSVIVVTSAYDRDDISRCFTLGADDYIHKPLSQDVLEIRIESVLSRRAVLQEKEASFAARFQGILDLSPDAVLLLSNASIVLKANAAAETMFGAVPDGLIGSTVDDLLIDGSGNVSTNAPARGRTEYDTGHRRSLMGRRLDGGTFPAEAALRKVDAELGPDAILWVRDVTERKRRDAELQALQNQLSRALGASAMGELGTMMAHELNQPLASVTSYLGAVQRLLKREDGRATPAVHDILGKAADQARRGGEIIAGLRRLLATGDVSWQALDLNEVARTARDLAAAPAGLSDVEIRVVPASDVPTVLGDRVQLLLAVTNLIRNAIDAVRRGPPSRSVPGCVRIETATDGDRAVLTVRDNGPGLAGVPTDGMFDMLVSSGSTGMGVGLAIVKTAVDRHGGSVSAADGPDGGAVFAITLPASNRSHDRP